MKIRYQNTIDDLVAFNRYFAERTPIIKQQARTMSIFVFFIVLLACFTLMYPITPWEEERPTWFILLKWSFFFVLALSAAVFTYFLWQPFILRNIGKTARKMLSHDPDKIALAERELEVTRSELIERNDFGEFHWKLSVIERLAETPDYVFVRLSSARAYILPRGA